MKSKKSNLTSILLFLILAISVGLIGLTGCSQATTNDTTLLSNSTSDTGNADNPAWYAEQALLSNSYHYS